MTAARSRNDQQQPSRAMARAVATVSPELQALMGSETNPSAIAQKLETASKLAFIISPSTSVGSLPEGCAVAFTAVLVDVDKETYSTGSGNVALSKSALDRIAQAAGISWDPRQSGRIDDRSDPRYCAWHAVGHVRRLDGRLLMLEKSKEVDLRDGSPQVESIIQKAKEAKPPRDPMVELRQARMHIMQLAESKAQNRAVRSIGVRSSYKPEELKKPFVVASLMWTGQSNDPELHRAFAMKTADAMLGGVRMMYGEDAPATIYDREAIAIPQLHAPPPVGGSIHDDDPIEEPAAAKNPTVEGARRQPPPPASEPRQQPQRQPPPQQQQATSTPDAEYSEEPNDGEEEGDPAPSEVCVRFGKSQGESISNITERTLIWYESALAENVADPGKARWRDQNEADLAAVREEMDFRGLERL